MAHTECIGSTSSITVMIIEPIPSSSGLSGELSVYHASLYNNYDDAWVCVYAQLLKLQQL